jgi:hypothetical protein
MLDGLNFDERCFLGYSIWNFVHTQKKEYFEKFFCCTKISFARARIHSLQINIFGLERKFTLPEEYLLL